MLTDKKTYKPISQTVIYQKPKRDSQFLSVKREKQMFNALYDKATHQCNECNWGGD